MTLLADADLGAAKQQISLPGDCDKNGRSTPMCDLLFANNSIYFEP